ncbi:MAG: bifunctional precorrin-2 dehydrogenase/sirohydrochlorin ferrochelatase [Candidatus Tectimicrobiota bacterium]
MDTPYLFPISLNLQHKPCLVVGGGTIAERRVQTLLSCGAVVHLVSPEATSWLSTAAQQGALRWTPDVFQPAHLEGIAIVLVATNQSKVNAEIAALARQRHCLINVVDDPAHCDFYLPAVVRRGALALAISTEGQAPAFAGWLRKQLEQLLDPQLGEVLAHYAAQRLEMQQRYPDLQARSAAWAALLAAEAPTLFTLRAAQETEVHTTS